MTKYLLVKSAFQSTFGLSTYNLKFIFTFSLLIWMILTFQVPTIRHLECIFSSINLDKSPNKILTKRTCAKHFRNANHS